MTKKTYLYSYEILQLQEVRSSEEWTRVAHKIKEDHGGDYPSDWWERVIIGGILGDVQKYFYN